MKWVLVLIGFLDNGQFVAAPDGVFDNMEDCFWAREYMAEQLGGSNGYYPVNTQGICLQVEDKYFSQ